MRLMIAQHSNKGTVARPLGQAVSSARAPQLRSIAVSLLNHQYTHGNRYVQRMWYAALILRKCANLSCSDCGEEQPTSERVAISLAPRLVVSPVVHEAPCPPDQLLNPARRASMEPRFGRHYGPKRVHTDARAPKIDAMKGQNL